jgi:ElaB/YqjD/DUF883 family membrane-anchored ribosome-binding protein
MPQRLYSSSDAPDYSTFPENPRDVTRSEGVNAQSNAPVVVEVEMEATYAEPQSTSGISDKVNEMKERGKELVERAGEYASDLKEDMAAAGSRWVEMAQENARQLRHRTQEFSRTAVRDYPIHVILAAGLVGLLVGISLRVWRENRV